MVLKYTIIGIVFGCLLTIAKSQIFYKYSEGPCGRKYSAQENINTTWMESANVIYLSAGNRYNIFRYTWRPEIESMPDYQFYSGVCPQATIDSASSLARMYTFGKLTGTYDVRPVSPGVTDYIGPKEYPSIGDVSRDTITLTDNKSFVFIVNCVLQSDNRGWKILSSTNNFDDATRKLIEDHAASFGFDRKEFVFLNYDRCGPIDSSTTTLPTPGTTPSPTTPNVFGNWNGFGSLNGFGGLKTFGGGNDFGGLKTFGNLKSFGTVRDFNGNGFKSGTVLGRRAGLPKSLRGW